MRYWYRLDGEAIAAQRRDRLDWAVLSAEALVVRFFGEADDDRLLLLNWGQELSYCPAPEPLLAPVPGRDWRLVWSSDHPDYGGPGIVNPCTKQGWHIPAANATLFSSARTER
jgi:maltooligosyltrehalose trehalohydrolase